MHLANMFHPRGEIFAFHVSSDEGREDQAISHSSGVIIWEWVSVGRAATAINADHKSNIIMSHQTNYLRMSECVTSVKKLCLTKPIIRG